MRVRVIDQSGSGVMPMHYDFDMPVLPRVGDVLYLAPGKRLRVETVAWHLDDTGGQADGPLVSVDAR